MNATARTFLARLAVALVAGVALGWGISSCGSAGSGTVSEKAGQAASTAKTQADGKLDTATKPEKTTTSKEKTPTSNGATKTVTQPAQTTTVTTTKTEKAPAPSTTVTNQTTNVAPASDESSGGLPWWGWVLIAIALVGGGSAIFLVGRNRGRRPPPDGTARPGGPVDPPPPGGPSPGAPRPE